MKKVIFTVTAILLLVLISQSSSQGSLGYKNYQKLTSELKGLQQKHPHLVRLNDLGKTIGGKSIWQVSVSAGNPDEKPALLIVAGVNGADLASTEICLNFIRNLAEQYDHADSIKNLLQRYTIYAFPRVNPDAAEAFFASPRYERRLNARSMDLDKDGVADEDGYEDLNGDGFITMMRVADPLGEYIPDKDMPQLLRKADVSKGESGKYRLLTEGIDNDHDGEWNEDETGGVDFNRNFSYHYKFFSKGAGVYQVSEVETRAVADFCFAHSNIAAVFSFSPNDNLLHPWKASQKPQQQPQRRWGHSRKPVSSVLSGDAKYYSFIAEKFKKITGLKDAPEPEKGEGDFCEWAYYHYGRWSFSTLTWWPPLIKEKPDSTEKAKSPKKGKAMPMRKNQEQKDELARQRRLWKWLQATGQQDAFIPWTEIKHPDFPDQKVEIGGFKPYVAINPPADSLNNLTEKFNDFLIYLTGLLPEVKIKNVKVEPLEDNVYRLDVFVTNTGYLPSNSELGSRIQWARKVKAEIRLGKDQKLATGRKIKFFPAIAGSGGTEKVTWMVVGEKGSQVTITVGSPMAGSEEKMVTLK